MLRFGLDKAVGSLEINTISVRNIAVTILMTGLFFHRMNWRGRRVLMG